MVPFILGVLLLVGSVAQAATLEIPTSQTTLSGIGVVSGWKCDAGDLTVRFDGGPPLPLVWGSERQDVLNAEACDHDRVGFVAIMNWGNLSDGQHTAVVYDDGVEFDRSTFDVVTTGEPFLRGASGQCLVDDFPAPGEQGRFIWDQSTQSMQLAEVRNAPTTEPPVHGQCGSSRNSCRAGTFSDISDTSSHYRWQCVGSHGGQTASCQAAKPVTPTVDRFNGSWSITARYTSSGCNYPSERFSCRISSGNLSCSGGGIQIQGTLSSSGSASGGFYQNGQQIGAWDGRFSERSGSGRWVNAFGCSGDWSASKQ